MDYLEYLKCKPLMVTLIVGLLLSFVLLIQSWPAVYQISHLFSTLFWGFITFVLCTNGWSTISWGFAALFTIFCIICIICGKHILTQLTTLNMQSKGLDKVQSKGLDKVQSKGLDKEEDSNSNLT